MDSIPALFYGAALYFLLMAVFVWGPEQQKAQIMEEVRQEFSQEYKTEIN